MSTENGMLWTSCIRLWDHNLLGRLCTNTSCYVRHVTCWLLEYGQASTGVTRFTYYIVSVANLHSGKMNDCITEERSWLKKKKTCRTAPLVFVVCLKCTELCVILFGIQILQQWLRNKGKGHLEWRGWRSVCLCFYLWRRPDCRRMTSIILVFIPSK